MTHLTLDIESGVNCPESCVVKIVKWNGDCLYLTGFLVLGITERHPQLTTLCYVAVFTVQCASGVRWSHQIPPGSTQGRAG